MEFTYDEILEWMERYFEAYNKYSQDPETTQRMAEYFAEDMEFSCAIAQVKDFKGRDEFLRIVSSHPSHRETLTPEDVIIDVKKKTVVVLAQTDICDTKTGELLVREKYLVRYQLTIDDAKKLKIRTALLFKEILPAGSMTEVEVMKRDPVTAQVYIDLNHRY